MVLYRLLIRLLRFINQLYFVEIRATGREHVPREGPVILAANHPASILDSILLATQIRRPIHYLARSGLFRFPILATVFRQLGAVPIYRAAETEDSLARNQAVFAQVHELLDQGSCIGIFPEGRNSLPTRIGPMRKGTARLALAAEARHDYRQGLVIVPVGVNFEGRGFLMSAALLSFGKPIRVADYAERHRRDPARAYAELTEKIRQRILARSLHADDDRISELAESLSQVLEHRPTTPAADGADLPPRRGPFARLFWHVLAWYRRTTPETSLAFERRMVSRQQINAILTRAWQKDPRRVMALNLRLERYRDHLRQTELREAMSHSFEAPVRERLLRLRMTAYAVLMAPVALFGLIHNVVPYLLTRLLGQLSRDEAVRAFVYFGMGVLLFATSYGLLGWWAWRHTELSPVVSLLYLASLPPTGFVALRYRRNVLVYRDKILVRAVFFNRLDLVELLREERQRLRRQLDELARRFPAQDPG